MQRHVNDWAGTLKAAIPFLQILQCNANAVPVMEGKDNELAAVLHEATDIVEAAETSFNAGYGTPQTLVQELASVINRRSLENGSNTPDFILADYLSRCLVLFDDATKARATWYGQPMKDLEFKHVIELGPKPEALKTAEEKKAEQLHALHKTPYGANLGINSPEIVPGLKFANIHMPAHSFHVLKVDTEKNSIRVQMYKNDNEAGCGWCEDWDLKHTRVGFERGEYWEIKSDGCVLDKMRKQAGREIMADIEATTLQTCAGDKIKVGIPDPLSEEFNRVNTQLAELWQDGRVSSQEYKDLQKRANELAETMNKTKKEAIEKEAGDKMARMVADVMQVTDSFVKAAKAIQVFNREAKEAEATRKKFEHMAPKTGGQNPHTGKKYITDEKGFLFVAGNGEILWALHDGAKYCFCNWEGGAWIGWRVSEADVIEAGHTQLPIFLDHFIRSIMPTQHPNKPI